MGILFICFDQCRDSCHSKPRLECEFSVLFHRDHPLQFEPSFTIAPGERRFGQICAGGLLHDAFPFFICDRFHSIPLPPCSALSCVFGLVQSVSARQIPSCPDARRSCLIQCRRVRTRQRSAGRSHSGFPSREAIVSSMECRSMRRVSISDLSGMSVYVSSIF